METNRSSLLVSAIWVWIVGGGLVQGFNLPTSEISQQFPIPWPVLIALPFSVIIGALLTKEIPGEFSVGKYVDGKFGQDTYRRFMGALRPELLFSSMSFGIGIVGLARTVQLTGPSGAFSISAFFISAGLAFLAAHFIGRRRGLYEKRTVAPKPLKVASSMEAAVFWKQAKVRRNLFFVTFVGWLIVGPVLVAIYSNIFPVSNEITAGFSALITWGAVIFCMQFRLRQLRCFRCGEQAFSHPLFFMKDAKCRSCGVRYREIAKSG